MLKDQIGYIFFESYLFTTFRSHDRMKTVRSEQNVTVKFTIKKEFYLRRERFDGEAS